MSMGNNFFNTNPIYLDLLIGAFSQISKHNINYSLRYLKEEYLHNCTVKIDEALRMYHRNIFQLSAKTKDDHNKKKKILKSNYNLNFLISIAHLFLQHPHVLFRDDQNILSTVGHVSTEYKNKLKRNNNLSICIVKGHKRGNRC